MIRLGGSLVIAHSDRQLAADTYKGTGGHHPPMANLATWRILAHRLPPEVRVLFDQPATIGALPVAVSVPGSTPT